MTTTKLDIHILLDAIALAARGGPLDPETCQTIQDIAKEYKYSDFSESDIQALYDCGSMRPMPSHSDDEAVDRFCTAMKEKLARARKKGRCGWEDKNRCTNAQLSDMLRDHAEKGDPVDVANFCMFIHQREERIAPKRPVPPAIREIHPG